MCPPKHLSPESKRWWRQLATDYAITPHHHRVLTLACEAWDRCVSARQEIERHGLTYDDPKRGPRMRPEVVIERDSRAAFAALVKQLKLDDDDTPLPTMPGVRPHRKAPA